MQLKTLLLTLVPGVVVNAAPLLDADVIAAKIASEVVSALTSFNLSKHAAATTTTTIMTTSSTPSSGSTVEPMPTLASPGTSVSPSPATATPGTVADPYATPRTTVDPYSSVATPAPTVDPYSFTTPPQAVVIPSSVAGYNTVTDTETVLNQYNLLPSITTLPERPVAAQVTPLSLSEMTLATGSNAVGDVMTLNGHTVTIANPSPTHAPFTPPPVPYPAPPPVSLNTTTNRPSSAMTTETSTSPLSSAPSATPSPTPTTVNSHVHSENGAAADTGPVPSHGLLGLVGVVGGLLAGSFIFV